MKPIIIRDGPSRKANFKIQAAKLQYEIYSLTQRLRYTNFRAENEEKVRSLGKNAMAFGYCYVIYLPIRSLFFPFAQRRETVEREVRVLREKISVLKIHISTITKVWPVNYVFSFYYTFTRGFPCPRSRSGRRRGAPLGLCWAELNCTDCSYLSGPPTGRSASSSAAPCRGPAVTARQRTHRLTCYTF